MNKDGKPSLGPINYLKIFFRRKELFIFPLFLGLVFGVCAGMVLPKKFAASTILLVEDGKSDNPFFSNLTVASDVQQRLATIKESMLGWNSLVELVKRLGLDKDIKTPQQLEGTILGIRHDITIKMKGKNIIELSYVGKEPEMTQAVVKNVTEIFIERNVNIQSEETGDAISFIEEQLKVYQGKIRSAEIASYKEQLNALLVDTTENHPQVRQLREIIKLKEKELKDDNLEYTENISLNDDIANPIISEIKKALDGIEGGDSAQKPTSVTALQAMAIDPVQNVVARDKEVNAQIYNMLLQRLETAKITQRLQKSKEGTKYTVLDPPRLPLAPVWPNKFLVSMVGLAAGAFIGFALVVFVEFFDKSFIDVEDTKKFLGRPLLGAISKIMTEDTIRKEREKLVWTYGLMVLAGTIIIISTTAVANFLQ